MGGGGMLSCCSSATNAYTDVQPAGVGQASRHTRLPKCDELAEEERGLGGSCRLGGPRRLGVRGPFGFASGGLGTL